MRAIIICDGKGSRWGDHLGIPKHLVPVDGEPILHRTVRLLKENGVEQVYVVSPPGDDRYAVKGASRIQAKHDHERWADADKFLSSAHYWNRNGRTIVVYGDIFLSDEAARTIVGHQGQSWTLFGRFGPSAITGGKHAEVFALSFYPEDHAKQREALEETARLYHSRMVDRCGGWELYRVMNGQTRAGVRHRSPQPKLGRHVEIDDWTEDFDEPSDYDTFMRLRGRPAEPVTVVVPLAITDEHRERAWAYVKSRWETEYPDWPIVTGTCEGPWRKAVAVGEALKKAEGICIVADADVWTPGIEASVAALQRGDPWSKPHRKFVRLTPVATERVLAGEDPDTVSREPSAWLEQPYAQKLGGAVVVVRKEDALRVPMDPRFVGWGGEDLSWGAALKVLVGVPHVGKLRTVHLWHPPQARVERNKGSPATEALRERYRQARRSPALMRALVHEFRKEAW